MNDLYRNYSEKQTTKRPMSASTMAKSSRNGHTIITSQSSKMNFDASNIDIRRIKPKKVRGEKERLYEDALKMKIQNNQTSSINVRLKTQVTKLEKECQEKDMMINELINQKDISLIGRIGQKVNKRKFESYLTTSLKKQIKELKGVTKDKDLEIGELRKNIKITRMQEMDWELRTYMDECVRLRAQLEEIM